MITNKVTKAVRLAIAFGAASALTFSTAIWAQENEEENKEEEKAERISVTGSRIMRPELSQPTPILSLEAKDIARFGTPDLGSVLAELPAIGATATIVGNNNSNASAGLSSADLRRLGVERTLVLVNGKRHVAGAPGSAQVDLTTIPTALIERVDVITGGASAIYGSDAVTGVVNVILKDNFEGFELKVMSTGSTESVGNETQSFSLVAGAEMSDGRGNVTFFVGGDKFEETMSRDLRQLENWGTIANPADDPSAPDSETNGIPDRLRVPQVGSEMINRFGVLNPFSSSRITFDAAGNPVSQCERDGTNSFAFGNFPGGCSSAFFTEEYENYMPEVDRMTVGATMHWDLVEDVQLVADFKYTDADIIQQFQPSFRFGNLSINVAENAFLTPATRELLGGEGQVSFAKFFDELGNRFADNKRELFRYVIGIEGAHDIGNSAIDYEVFYLKGETSNTRVTRNDLIIGNIVAAVDSVIDPDTGRAMCRSQVASAQPDGYVNPATVDAANCVAYNPFGYQLASKEARDWVSADTTRQDRITQEVFGASFALDSSQWFELPGGAMGMSAGIETRKEEYHSITDELTKSGVLAGAATPDEFAEYDVDEWFVEFSFPLIADKPFARELTFDAAFRSADYSHAGSADAWKLSLLWAPVDDIRLRSTHGIAVRAPNLGEAFSPQSPGFARVSDPCDADNLADDEHRAANCAALGLPADFQANDNVSIDVVVGGNPDLVSEESTSTTVGFVWTPSYVKGFSWTLDWYDIVIEDAISEITAQQIADNCVDGSAGPDSNFCGAIDRDPVTGDIDFIRSGFLNAAKFKARGVESDIRYRTDMADWGYKGDLAVSLFMSKLIDLEKFEFQNLPDEVNVEAGEVGDPEWQYRMSTTYSLDDWAFNWTWRHIDRSVTYDITPDEGSPEDLSPGYIPSITTHDFSFNYYLSENIEISGGIRNAFDKVPPGYTVNGLYDLIGRRYFLGFNMGFE